MLLYVDSTGAIQGLKVTKNAPSIFYLFFANDSFISYRANLSGVREIKVFDEYCDMSGWLINSNKSAIYLS